MRMHAHGIGLSHSFLHNIALMQLFLLTASTQVLHAYARYPIKSIAAAVKTYLTDWPVQRSVNSGNCSTWQHSHLTVLPMKPELGVDK